MKHLLLVLLLMPQIVNAGKLVDAARKSIVVGPIAVATEKRNMAKFGAVLHWVTAGVLIGTTGPFGAVYLALSGLMGASIEFQKER